MKIIFHENQLSYRGTSLAIYDYAQYNQSILNNESVILYNKTNPNNFENAVSNFKSKFNVIGYENINELEKIVEKEKVDVFYAIKSGEKDGIEVSNCKTCIHTVFKNYDPHGDVYAYVSQWLSEIMTQNKSPFVPHIVNLPNYSDNLRKSLNIPNNAIVFGRHGGAETFDINFVKQTILKFSRKRKDVYFLFLGTNPFTKKSFFRPYKNIIFLPATIDLETKVKFINTCDAYIHARNQGESFGLSVAEFSIKNKPIITWKNAEEKAHLQILGNKAILYENTSDLYNILDNFEPNTNQNWDCYSENFSPKKVMQKFESVFLK
jgi:hypothetical protein